MQVTTPITFVSGKGGVGKSLVAAGLALQASQKGLKTLLIEFGDNSFYEKFFQVDSLREAKLLKSNMYVMSLSAEDSLRHYISHFIKVRKVVDLFFNTKPMRALVKASPALKELALLGQVTSHVRHHGPELKYDRIIVDAYASGHLLALLRAPFGMYEAVKLGPMGEQCLSLQKTLTDSSVTSFKLVTLLEEAPVAETLELMQSLEEEFNIQAEVICNKVLDESVEAKQSEFSKITAQQISKQQSAFEELKKDCKVENRLPYIYELNSWKLVEGLAHSLGEST